MPSTQSAWTSTFWPPFLNSTCPGSGESSTDHPDAGTPASTGDPLAQSAYTVPPAVTYWSAAEVAEGTAVGEADSPARVAVAATGAAPGAADASTRDTARKPRPTAAAADAVHAAPSAMVRFMPQTLLRQGLRPPQ